MNTFCSNIFWTFQNIPQFNLLLPKSASQFYNQHLLAVTRSPFWAEPEKCLFWSVETLLQSALLVLVLADKHFSPLQSFESSDRSLHIQGALTTPTDFNSHNYHCAWHSRVTEVCYFSPSLLLSFLFHIICIQDKNDILNNWTLVYGKQASKLSHKFQTTQNRQLFIKLLIVCRFN